VPTDVPADDARFDVVLHVTVVAVDLRLHDCAVVLVAVCVELVEAEVLRVVEDADCVLLVALLVVVVCGV